MWPQACSAKIQVLDARDAMDDLLEGLLAALSDGS
jgi:hypothetical protein